MGLTWVARKRLKVGDGYRLPGEEVPEAANWTNLESYINTGQLVAVGTTEAPKAKPVTKKVEPTVEDL